MRNFFTFIALYAAGLNLLLCLLQLGLLRRRRPWSWAIGLGACLWTALVIGIFALQVLSPLDWRPFLRHWFYFPIAVELIWNLLFLQPLVLITIVVALYLRRRRPVASLPPPSPADLSRRKFVYLLACGAAPATAVAMGVHGSLSRYDLRVRKFQVPIADLAPELEGFTIAHVSDLHSGIFCGPRRLKIITSATNDLKADLVAVTGDIINDNMADFPAVLAAIQSLRSPCGTYVCEGNHDLIPGPGVVAAACVRNNVPWLSNSTVSIPVRGQRLLLGGVPWMGRRFDADPRAVSQLYPARQQGDVRILLAHHPHLFDSASSADLVLAGHTHGGQLMAGPVGFGPLLFKYWSGLYRRDDTTLIVSNGAGDWFPCRVGAPAEIALLRLTRKV